MSGTTAGQDRTEELEEKKIIRPQDCEKEYSVSYLHLFNTTVEELYGLSKPEERAVESTVGLVKWSTLEKTRLFEAVARKGRDNTPAIAQFIGSKSELEVRAYLRLLDQSVQGRSGPGDLDDIGLSEIPSAWEIGQQCERGLEYAAAALSYRQWKYELSVEKKKYGDLSVLDWRIPSRLDSLTNGPATDTPDCWPLLRTASEMLDLNMLLNLSARLFMNSSDPEYNWQTYAPKDEPPSMLCTAFLDLHNIVVHLTRRLVSTCLFVANSRIRAYNVPTRTLDQRILPTDVQAALEMLGMKIPFSDFWITLARRNRLEVFKEQRLLKHRQNLYFGGQLSYEEVEQALRQETASGIRSFISLKKSSQEPNPDSPLSSEDDRAESPSKSMSSPSDQESPRGNEEDSDGDNEAEGAVEVEDLKESFIEERRLWNLLEEDPPLADATMTEPSRPVLPRKGRWRPGSDWRKDTVFHFPWES